MNAIKRSLGIISLTVFLSACTGLGNHWSDPVKAVDDYSEQQQYTRAMEVIASVSSEDPHFAKLQKKRKQILGEIDRFEGESIKLQNRYKEKNQWPEAFAIIDDALKKIPASQRLIESRQALVKDRDHYINSQQLSLAVGQANSLPRAIKLLESIDAAEPGIKTNQQKLLVTRGQMNDAREILLNQAQSEAEQKKWHAAKDYLLLASELGSSRASRDLLAFTEKQIKLENTKTHKAQQLAYLKKRDDKLHKLDQALSEKDYLAAKKFAHKLEAFKQQDKQINKALDQYQKTINEEVNTLTEKGQQLYTKGFIDQAIKNWQLALQLDPVNTDIQERLRRAETFKASIEKFK